MGLHLLGCPFGRGLGTPSPQSPLPHNAFLSLLNFVIISNTHYQPRLPTPGARNLIQIFPNIPIPFFPLINSYLIKFLESRIYFRLGLITAHLFLFRPQEDLSLPAMSFFGFDTSLPRDRGHPATAPGFSQATDHFAGLSNADDDDDDGWVPVYYIFVLQNH